MRLALDREHPDDPRFAFDAATTLGNMGLIYRERGEPERAASALARAVELLRAARGRAPRECQLPELPGADPVQPGGDCLIDLGDLDGAGPLLAEADAVAERLAADQPGVVQHWSDLGLVRAAPGDARPCGEAGPTRPSAGSGGRSRPTSGRSTRRPNDPTALDERASTAIDLAALLNRLGRPGGGASSR